jgi:hypothetical protein
MEIIIKSNKVLGGTRWRSSLRLCTKSWKVEGSIADGVTGISSVKMRKKAGHVHDVAVHFQRIASVCKVKRKTSVHLMITEQKTRKNIF